MVLASEGTPPNRTGISEVIATAGPPRGSGGVLTRRAAGPRRDDVPRARALDGVTELPAAAPTRMAGLLLTLPDLLALNLPALVTAAGYPGTRDIPALGYLLSLLALKLTGTRRVLACSPY